MKGQNLPIPAKKVLMEYSIFSVRDKEVFMKKFFVLSSWSRIAAIGSIFMVAFLAACGDDDESWTLSARSNDEPSAESSSSVGMQAKSSMSKVLPPCNGGSNDSCEYETLIDERDGRSYKIVKIGGQWWMAENLLFVTDSNSFCDDDREENCLEYGRRYTWEAAMDACPAGWHLPLYSEWQTLIDTVGGRYVAGTMLKSFGGGGGRYGFSGTRQGDKSGAVYWSFTESDYNRAFKVQIAAYSEEAFVGDLFKEFTIPVRCIQGELKKPYRYRERCIECASENKQEFLASFSNLTVEMESLTDDRDGQSYKIVKIGDQWWMAENLRYNASDSPKKDVRGNFYSWGEAMDSVGRYSENGKNCGDGKLCMPNYPVQGICPKGWHLPSVADYEILFMSVGGQSVAGLLLKANADWPNSIPNNPSWGFDGNGADVYGFSAYPGGVYSKYYDRNVGYLLTSTENSYGDAIIVRFRWNYDYVGFEETTKSASFYLRCVRN